MEAYSVSEAIKVTKKMLETVRLPISEMKTTGQIILTAVDNLQNIYDAIIKAEKEAKEQENQEPEIEFVEEKE